MANTLAYYDMAEVTAVESFMVQALVFSNSSVLGPFVSCAENEVL